MQIRKYNVCHMKYNKSEIIDSESRNTYPQYIVGIEWNDGLKKSVEMKDSYIGTLLAKMSPRVKK